MNKNEGFSLVEVIISLAAIAILSIIILQAFIVAADGNQKAQDQDMAFLEASSIIESIKASKSLEEALEYLDTFSKATNSYEYQLNKQWEVVDIESEPSRKNVFFWVEIRPETKVSDAGTLLSVDITISNLSDTLCNLSGKKYFMEVAK